MTFLLSALIPALLTMIVTGALFYRRASIGKRAAQTLLRGGAAALCYVFIYLAGLLVMGGIYLALDSYGSTAATRTEAISLITFSTLASAMIATLPWQQVKG